MLENLANSLKSILPDAGDAMVDKAMGALNDPALGGVQGLVQKFEQGGLGEVARSWVGTGQNLPISAEQLQKVLGNEHVASLAAKFGIDPSEAAGKLSALLPGLVDKLTPEGKLPATT
ncbi:MAG: YidB family protein [Gemmatimonadaceae bacterium]|nr:YidB family protein [Gemmatimonadaceae bacterium]